MTQACPASSFVGYDFHADSIAAARKAVADAGLADRLSFEGETVMLAEPYANDEFAENINPAGRRRPRSRAQPESRTFAAPPRRRSS